MIKNLAKNKINDDFLDPDKKIGDVLEQLPEDIKKLSEDEKKNEKNLANNVSYL